MTQIFNNSNLLEKALDVSSLRHQIISNNIANVNTPEYQRKEVKFEKMLEGALDAGADVNNVKPRVKTDLSEAFGRIDGNNVNLDKEMSDLATNTIKYNALIRQLSSKFQNMQTVLK